MIRKFLAAAAVGLALAGGLIAATPASAVPAPSATGSPGPVTRHSVDSTAGVTFLGDSITEGGLVAPAERIDTQVRYRLPGVTTANQGHGGQRLVGGSPQAPTDLATTGPEVIASTAPGGVLVIDIGMNDLFAYEGDAAFTSAYVSLVTAGVQQGLHVLVCDITPVGSVNWRIETLRQRLNAWLASYFADRFLSYAAVLHDTRTGQTWMDVRFGWYDGIHVDEGGYDVMADVLVSRIQASGWTAALAHRG